MSSTEATECTRKPDPLKFFVLFFIFLSFSVDCCQFYFVFSFPLFCFQSFVFQDKCAYIQVWGYAMSHASPLSFPISLV
jgi:hypothetical protein